MDSISRSPSLLLSPDDWGSETLLEQFGETYWLSISGINLLALALQKTTGERDKSWKPPHISHCLRRKSFCETDASGNSVLDSQLTQAVTNPNRLNFHPLIPLSPGVICLSLEITKFHCISILLHRRCVLTASTWAQAAFVFLFREMRKKH